jgi:hypothetical protein
MPDAHLGLGTDTALGVNPNVLGQSLALLVEGQVLEELWDSLSVWESAWRTRSI